MAQVRPTTMPSPCTRTAKVTTPGKSPTAYNFSHQNKYLLPSVRPYNAAITVPPTPNSPTHTRAPTQHSSSPATFRSTNSPPAPTLLLESLEPAVLPLCSSPTPPASLTATSSFLAKTATTPGRSPAASSFPPPL